MMHKFLKQNTTKSDKGNVFLTNKVIGFSPNLFDKFKEGRCKTNWLANFFIDPITKEININTDEGRVLRPLFVITKNKKLVLDNYTVDEITGFTLEELVEHNIIAYLDAGEEKRCIISNDFNSLDADYLEITPELMFNIFSSLIPFINNNGAARYSYSQMMFKQA